MIESIPDIIIAIIDGLLNALPQLIEGCITLVVELVKNMPKIILGLIKAVPKIIASLVKAFGNGVGKFVEIGGNLIKGIWKGISDCASWIWDKISGFFGGIVDGIKDFFGINSPSKLFRDQIGKNLALGLGEGFESTMKNVGKDMQQAIPTDFDTQVQATANVNSFTNGNDNSFLGRAIQTFNNTINFGEVHINSEMDIDDVAHRVSSVIVSDILVKGGAYT